ncbi:MAG: hypothetical protein LBP59_16200 [Planctomycetaceae bacterium]|nr:hypothetical protein [Planctomycetaceae bacterium]
MKLHYKKLLSELIDIPERFDKNITIIPVMLIDVNLIDGIRHQLRLYGS